MSESTKVDDSKSSEEQKENAVAEDRFRLVDVSWNLNASSIYEPNGTFESIGRFELQMGECVVVIELRDGVSEMKIDNMDAIIRSVGSPFVFMRKNVDSLHASYKDVIERLRDEGNINWSSSQLFEEFISWSDDWDTLHLRVVKIHKDAHDFSSNIAMKTHQKMVSSIGRTSSVLQNCSDVFLMEYSQLNSDVLNSSLVFLTDKKMRWSSVENLDQLRSIVGVDHRSFENEKRRINAKASFERDRSECQKERYDFSESIQRSVNDFENMKSGIVRRYAISKSSWPSLNVGLISLNVPRLSREIFGFDWSCFELMTHEDIAKKQTDLHSKYTEEEKALDQRIEKVKSDVESKQKMLSSSYHEAFEYFSKKLEEVQGVEADYATKKLGREYAGYATETERLIKSNLTGLYVVAVFGLVLFASSVWLSTGSETVENVLRISTTVFVVSLTAYLARRITMLQKIQQHYAQRHVELSILREFFEDFPSDKKTEIVAELAPKFFGERVLDAKKEPDQLSVINELSGTLEKLAKITKEQTDKK